MSRCRQEAGRAGRPAAAGVVSARAAGTVTRGRRDAATRRDRAEGRRGGVRTTTPSVPRAAAAALRLRRRARWGGSPAPDGGRRRCGWPAALPLRAGSGVRVRGGERRCWGLVVRSACGAGGHGRPGAAPARAGGRERGAAPPGCGRRRGRAGAGVGRAWRRRGAAVARGGGWRPGSGGGPRPGPPRRRGLREDEAARGRERGGEAKRRGRGRPRGRRGAAWQSLGRSRPGSGSAPHRSSGARRRRGLRRPGRVGAAALGASGGEAACAAGRGANVGGMWRCVGRGDGGAGGWGFFLWDGSGRLSGVEPLK